MGSCECSMWKCQMSTVQQFEWGWEEYLLLQGQWCLQHALTSLWWRWGKNDAVELWTRTKLVQFHQHATMTLVEGGKASLEIRDIGGNMHRCQVSHLCKQWGSCPQRSCWTCAPVTKNKNPQVRTPPGGTLTPCDNHASWICQVRWAQQGA